MTPLELLELALNHQQQGRLRQAEQLYQHLIAVEPRHPLPNLMLGTIRAQQGRFSEALALVAPVHPKDAYAFTTQGKILLDLGKPQEALHSFEDALRCDPGYVDALLNRSHLLGNLGRPDEALCCFESVLKIVPKHPGALSGCGTALLELEEFSKAFDCYNQALLANPGDLNTLYGYANALRGMEKHEAAIANYTKLLTRIPDHAGALNNRGWCLMSLKRFDEALSDFERAIVLASDHQGAILNKALWHLLHGDFERGFALYEARQKLLKPMGYRHFPQPQWTGAETLEGKVLFVHSEQGLGDCMQFFRFLSALPAARTIFAVPRRLMRLLQSSGAPVEFIAEDQVPDGFDFHIPLMSLAKACHLRPDAIPGRDGYLSTEPQLVASWADRIGRHGFRIGIIWHGKDGALGANDKSFDLKCLSRLAQIPGVRLISLQKGESKRQLNDLPQTMPVERFAFDEGPDAFIDTAAIMKNLDLVITPDCAGAHLAGTLGVPAWVALKHVPDWRWLLDHDDSPWYASLRLFRQAKRGDWTSVFAQMEAELRKASPIRAAP